MVKQRNQLPKGRHGNLKLVLTEDVNYLGKQGDVVEVRTTSAQTVAVLDDARGCSHAPCLVRVVYGGDTRFKHGDVLRAYGRVTRSVASGSSTVPEVEADFVLLGHAPKR